MIGGEWKRAEFTRMKLLICAILSSRSANSVSKTPNNPKIEPDAPTLTVAG
jgi:hypothetical protein